jgi:nicotinate-nucleotide--dimethylbenzimidazole phosphoribosyltransferase
MGTRNFLHEPAMREDEALEAIAVGIDVAADAAARGVEIVALGEMGIGSTTAASAVAAALTGRPARELVGRGTGVDDEALERKISVVERALARHRPDPGAPLEILACVGGFEIAAICGACLGAAAHRTLVVVDGFIAAAGAALAARLAPPAADYMMAGHRSVERGHGALLDLMGLGPLLDLEMRLGEATGAALALPVVAAALAAFREMATFESAGVSDRE